MSSLYIAKMAAVYPGSDELVRHKKVWAQLIELGLLARLNLYRMTAPIEESDKPRETLEWSCLLMLQLAEGVTKAQFIEKEAEFYEGDDVFGAFPIAEVIPTPGSSHPDTALGAGDECADSDVLIEYINVEPGHLGIFREELMGKICGPAIKMFVDEGIARRILALEVPKDRLEFSPDWNQLHIGFYPKGTKFEEVLGGFDPCIRAVTKEKSDCASVFRRLKGMRVKYMDWSQCELSM